MHVSEPEFKAGGCPQRQGARLPEVVLCQVSLATSISNFDIVQVWRGGPWAEVFSLEDCHSLRANLP